MIKLTNLNKYYNKGKGNEIHVINDVSIEFPNTGLITLFGPSGCGKTTLLNVIGGLDKAKGIIEYNDDKINKYNANKLDNIRRNNIGYIFQNYNLLNTISVYDNLKLALSINDIIDNDEVNLRIENSLKAVSMYKYRKKQASDLSGGQQQRVAIARALVNKCNVIIADEPTGNLDSANSIEIMKILKSLSKNILVILVTHSKELAEYYSDKIIELKDGSVVNVRESDSSYKLSNNNTNKVFLKDLNNININSNNVNIDIYSNLNKEVNLTLVEVNGTYYLKSNVKIVEYNNQVEIVDSHKEVVEESKNDELDINYDNSNFKDVRKRNIFSLIKEDLSEIIKNKLNKKRKRIFKVLFFTLGLVLAILNFSFARSTFVETNNILTSSDGLILIDKDNNYSKRNTFKAYKQGYANEIITYSRKYIQFSYTSSSYISDSFSTYALVTQGKDSIKSNIIAGDNSACLIGRSLADYFVSKAHLSNYDELLFFFKINKYRLSSSNSNSYISGILDENTDMLYEPIDSSILDIYNTSGVAKGDKSYATSNTVLVNSIDNLDTNKLLVGSKEVENGKFLITSAFFNEIESITNDEIISNYKDYKIILSGNDYTDKVVGIVDSEELAIYTTNNDYRYIYSSSISNLYDSTIFTIEEDLYPQEFSQINDTNNLSLYLSNNKVTSNSYYNYQYNNYKESAQTSSTNFLIVAVICFAIIIIYIFFIMRTQIIKDIYEIGVKRSLGMRKSRIYLKYLLEIIVTMFETVLISFIILTIIIGLVNLKIGEISNSTFNIFKCASTYYMFFIILLISIIVGLIPVHNLVKKTPSEILAKYDI